MKVIHQWTVSLPEKSGRAKDVKFRLLRDERYTEKFALERCELDRAGGERWIDIKEWNTVESVKNALSDGNYSTTTLLTLALLELKKQPTEPTITKTPSAYTLPAWE